MPHPYSPRAGQREPELGALAREELVRDLDQNARPVARLRVAAAGAAVGEVDEDLDALADDLVRAFATDVGDEADAAGIVFVDGTVEPLRAGEVWSGCHDGVEV